jgi:hypothetical protein
MNPDFIVSDHGSLLLVTAQNASADRWLKSSTGDEAQWFGNALVVEPRYIADLVAGLENDGYVVG